MIIAKLDTRYPRQAQPRRCGRKALLGIGGTGREAVRTAYRQEQAFFGKACPYTLVGEVDLCGETGRGIEPTFVPDDPSTLYQMIFPGVNCRALVNLHRSNPAFPLWTVVDPNTIEEVEDTAELGGFARPQVARAVEELYAEQLEEFLRLFAQRIESLRHLAVKGWEVDAGPFQLFVYASLNGAVGSTALQIVDRLRPRLKAPCRVVFVPLLLADQGRVTDRAVATALQHAGLSEIYQRTRGLHE